MNTDAMWQTVSSSSADTLEIGERLGRRCKGGEIFLLKSDLGGGKTTFVKGLAKGLGSTDHVGSPTFTINRIYRAAHGLELQHFDFYRLNDAGIVTHELSEVINDPSVVVAIEWGDIINDALPKRRVELCIEHQAGNEDARKLTFNYPTYLSYIFKGLA